MARKGYVDALKAGQAFMKELGQMGKEYVMRCNKCGKRVYGSELIRGATALPRQPATLTPCCKNTTITRLEDEPEHKTSSLNNLQS